MKWNLYDDTIGEWGEVVIKQNLDAHAEKVASETDYGHVKIDGETLTINAEGKLKVNDAISNTYTPTVYFNIGGNIVRGRIDEAHFYTPFNCKIKSINVSLVQFSNNPLNFNLQKTPDFTIYNDVFENDLTLSPLTHVQEFNITEDVVLNAGELVFVNITDTIDDARNMLLTMTIEKI